MITMHDYDYIVFQEADYDYIIYRESDYDYSFGRNRLHSIMLTILIGPISAQC